MRQEIAVHLPEAAPERIALTAAAAAGGSRADAILLPGLAPGAVRLVPVAAGVVVEANAAGVRVAGHAVAPGARRLLRPGERAEVQGAAIVLERSAPDGPATRVAAASLLRDAAAGGLAIAGPRLVVLTGRAAGDRHPLGAAQTIGRGRAATIRIADPQASRVHARLCLAAGGATLEDLRSKNGVRVNGVSIGRGPCPVAAGDGIAVGETVLALEDPWPAPAHPPHADAPCDAAAAPRRIPARLAAAALLALSAAALAVAGS